MTRRVKAMIFRQSSVELETFSGLRPKWFYRQANNRGAEALSVACYWAVRELGMTTVEVSRRLGITQSAVTKAVYRGEKLAKDRDFQMMPDAKRKKSYLFIRIVYTQPLLRMVVPNEIILAFRKDILYL